MVNDENSFAYARKQAEPRAIKTAKNSPAIISMIFDGACIYLIRQTTSEIDQQEHYDLSILLSNGRHIFVDVKAVTLKNRRGKQTNYTIDKASIDFIRDIKFTDIKKSYWYMLEVYDDNKQPTGAFILVQAQKLVEYIDKNNVQPMQSYIKTKDGKTKIKFYYLIIPNIVKTVEGIDIFPSSDIPF